MHLNTCEVRRTMSAHGYLHSRRALWYRRPCVCLSTCSGDLLMCRRVSLQNSWCLGDRDTSVGRDIHEDRHQRLSTTAASWNHPESDSRGLRGGPGSRSNSTLQLGWRSTDPDGL